MPSMLQNMLRHDSVLALPIREGICIIVLHSAWHSNISNQAWHAYYYIGFSKKPTGGEKHSVVSSSDVDMASMMASLIQRSRQSIFNDQVPRGAAPGIFGRVTPAPCCSGITVRA
jgi:hypothetical protein